MCFIHGLWGPVEDHCTRDFDSVLDDLEDEVSIISVLPGIFHSGKLYPGQETYNTD